jgi:hypothetical protein
MTHSGRLDIEVCAYQQRKWYVRRLIILNVLTKSEGEVDPAGNKAPVEMAMSNNENVSGSFSLLEPLAVFLSDLLLESITRHTLL